MRRRAIAPVALTVALLVSAACSGGDDDDARPRPTSTTSSSTTTSTAATSTSTSPATAGPSSTARRSTTRPPGTTTGGTAAPGPPAGPPVPIKLTRVASLSQPVALAQAPNDDALYLVEKGGRVRAIRNGTVDPTPALDISGQVSRANEQGLLGLAFSPDRPLMYVYFTNTTGDIRVVEYGFAGGRADAGSARTVLAIAHPVATNHNGGQLQFGPDEQLYVAVGDGGGAGDPEGDAQRLNTLLGKILRISPYQAGGQAYTIPAGNPFTGAGQRGEIWSYGLRNPWRFSFDRATGDLWIADVGQGQWEEIDHVAAGTSGHNFGWNAREGTHPYNGGSKPAGAVDPVYDYGHSGGNCSVTGGYVSRGSRLTGWGGQYLFADYCVGRLRRLGPGGEVADTNAQTEAVSSFGEDRAGELYVLSLSGGVYRIDPS